MPSSFAHLQHVIRSRDPATEQRRAARDLVDMISHATVRGRTCGIHIINISPLGLMCRTDADLVIAERLTVWLPFVRDIPATVRWMEGGRAGIEFVPSVSPQTYESMLALMPPRQNAW